MKYTPKFTSKFLNKTKKLKRGARRELKKRVEKILEKPSLGKPLRYSYKNLRSERSKKFRIIYEIENRTVIFHTFEHGEKVYKR